MNEELMTNEIVEEAIESVVEEPIVDSSSDWKAKVIIGIGTLVVAGVTAYAIKKHKEKKELESEDETEPKKRKFTLLHKTAKDEEVESDSEDESTEE